MKHRVYLEVQHWICLDDTMYRPNCYYNPLPLKPWQCNDIYKKWQDIKNSIYSKPESIKNQGRKEFLLDHDVINISIQVTILTAAVLITDDT